MGLNNISGGRGFSLGKFTQNFNAAADHGALKSVREPIRRIVAKNEAAIKGGRFKSSEILRKLQRDENMSYDVKRDVSRIFKRLETPATVKSDRLERQAILDKAMKKNDTGVKPVAKDRPDKAPIKVRINRADSEFNQEKVKNNRVSALQDRLKEATGVSGPMGKPTPPPAASRDSAPAATHEHISLD